MKWVTMLLLTIMFVGCAHQKQDRSVSSVDEQQEKPHRQGLGETFSSRY
jgi:outer membrane biogenesis lipoprotein LolB